MVAVAGDGDFLMCGQGWPAVQHGLDVVVLVVNNGRYGTIRMHQERSCPGQVIATDLDNPGSRGRGLRRRRRGVTDTESIPGGLRAGPGRRAATLLDLHVDPEAIAPACPWRRCGAD